MKIKLFKQFNESNSVFVSDAQVDSILDVTKGKNLSDIQKRRMEISVKGDHDISDIINRMAGVTQQFKDLMETMKDYAEKNPNGGAPKDLMQQWHTLKTELKEYEKEIESFGIKLGDEALGYFMKNERPDVY